jgi:hypothetical protein
MARTCRNRQTQLHDKIDNDRDKGIDKDKQRDEDVKTAIIKQKVGGGGCTAHSPLTMKGSVFPERIFLRHLRPSSFAVHSRHCRIFSVCGFFSVETIKLVCQ